MHSTLKDAMSRNWAVLKKNGIDMLFCIFRQECEVVVLFSNLRSTFIKVHKVSSKTKNITT